MNRRQALLGGAALALGVPTVARAQSVAPVLSRGRTKIVVLGSLGGQQMTQIVGANLRCGTSVLIDVDGVLTVLDCGCGSTHRIVEAGYDLNKVRNVVITHHHADHVADLGSLALLAWSSGRNGGDPNRRLDIYGPTGTKAFAKGLRESMAISIADQQGPLGQQPKYKKFAHWHEFKPPKQATRVFKDARFHVRAIRVKHGSVPAVGYRIKTPDLDIAFSGDRGAEGDSFVAFARGADALFHEIIDKQLVVAALTAQQVAPTFIDHLVKDHSDPETVGRAASAARVPVLVLYHLIPGNPAIADLAWTAQVAPYYSGKIIVGRDLLVV